MPSNEASFNVGMELLLDTVQQLTEYLKKEFMILEGTDK